MQRVTRATRVVAKPAAPAPEATAGFFDPGDPVAGRKATVPGYEWFNHVQEEIAGVIEGAGIALNPADDGQLLKAINAIVAALIPTGSVRTRYDTAAAAGWVPMSGRTIGSAASGATERANADTQTLFTYLWGKTDNTILQLQDNTGANVARGASALADFNAGRRLSLPDARGRTLRGLDNLGGTAANRITVAQSGIDGTILGKVGGDERLHQHNHGVTDPGHHHSLPWQKQNTQPNATTPSPTILETGATNTADSVTGVTIQNAGAGGSQNVSPTLLVLHEIKL
jgi:hypothetical protein